ncbi:MAG TPA: ATP-binding protein, partial [Nocardia sp.]|uniref:ATP-binding protein n=1 Tax=Nocardia sp. TaxID=1821 RepID=UPI002B4B1545
GGEGEDSRQDVFAVFPRTDDQRTGGAGLGLTVARGFVEVMGGTLTAAEPPGGGATMVIDLPAPDGARR